MTGLATAGALTLEKLDDRTGGQDVIYRYDVINLGDELSNVMVEDSELVGGHLEGDGAERLVGGLVVTVETAFANGADYIVVGRPIRDAARNECVKSWTRATIHCART